eukprot:GILI01002317.1.p2 GENE.GILI01002317.1~~GILI01002317.1.p2  ORF type:complete len:276 (+),score=69.46 GILI01002317.1:65-892(+)
MSDSAREALAIDTNHDPQEAVIGNTCCPSGLSAVLSCIFPCAWCCACQTVNVNEHIVLSYWGKLAAVIREPGCYCLNPMGVDVKRVTTKAQSIEVSKVKVNDLTGTPVIVDGVAIVRVKEAAKAVLNVENYRVLITQLAPAVLKHVVSQYPYEAADGQPSLKRNGKEIGEKMAQELQERVKTSGVDIISFELTDLSYAPEIAASMLVRQQASAMLSARRLIVEGAVGIASDAVRKLEETGLKISDEDKARTVSNLLTVLCSESRPTPTIDLSATS